MWMELRRSAQADTAALIFAPSAGSHRNTSAASAFVDPQRNFNPARLTQGPRVAPTRLGDASAD
jgi:hypothetical protein